MFFKIDTLRELIKTSHNQKIESLVSSAIDPRRRATLYHPARDDGSGGNKAWIHRGPAPLGEDQAPSCGWYRLRLVSAIGMTVLIVAGLYWLTFSRLAFTFSLAFTFFF